jgi:hypothetical protein
MALSREVEIILRANGASVKSAIKTISDAAEAATDDVIKNSLEDYGDKVGSTAASIISRALDSSNRKFRDNLISSVDNASKSIAQKLKDISAIQDPTQQAEGLRALQKQMAAFEKLASQEIQDALKIGVRDAFSASNLRDAVSGLSDTFEKALNGMDPNDLGGFAKSLGGAASKGLGKLREGYKAKQVAASAVGNEAAAAAAGRGAAAMGALALAATAVAAVFALFIAWAKAADDYQAKLNKTLLSGAGVADVLGASYTSGAQNLLSLTDTMGAARRAAVDTAVAFRMTTDETAQVLQDLNSAGITYKTIVNGARTAAEAQYKFAEAINRTITYSSMLGVSVSELAAYQNTLMKDVNLSLDRTFDVFGAISKASAASGMATKTFFTAISQATSGMALYNVRIDQAIGLVSAFSKSVGETDAGKVLGELTGKKGVDERLRMAATAVESVGLKDVQALFSASANAAADEFQRSFGRDKGTSDAIKKVFADAGVGSLGEGLMSGNAEDRRKATAALADLPDALREQIKAGMENIQGGAASRAFGATALVAKGSKGDLDTIAGAMNQLDMASKLALMDQQLKIMEGQGVTAESATGKATAQKFLEALGLNEELLEPLLRSRQYLAAAGRVRGGTGTDTDTTMLTGAGFKVEGRSVKDQSGREISDIADVYRGLGVKMDSDEQTRKDRSSAIEKQRMQGTITDALNAWVQGTLFENALADQGLLGTILKVISKGEYDPEKMAKQREAQEKVLVDAQARVDAAQGKVDTAVLDRDRIAAENALAYEKQKLDVAKVATTLSPEGTPIADVLTQLPGAETLDTTGQPTGIAGKVSGPGQAYQEAYERAALARRGGQVADHNGGLVAPAAIYAVEAAAASALESTLGAMGAPVSVRDGKVFSADPTAVEDAFVSKDGAMYRGPSADNILMFKDGGPLDPRTGGGGGGNVVININGGDQAMVYRTVARAMRASQ